jgi:hypothetical protein
MAWRTVFTVLGKSENGGNLKTAEERELALECLEAQGQVYGYTPSQSKEKTAHEGDHLKGLGNEVLEDGEILKLIIQKEVGTGKYRFAIDARNITDKHVDMLMSGVRKEDKYFSEGDSEIIASRSRV